MATLLAEQSAAAVSPTLALATTSAVFRFATVGQSTAGAVPAAVVTLSEGVVNAMTLNRLTKQLAILLLCAVVTTGALVAVAGSRLANPGSGEQTSPLTASVAFGAPALPEIPLPVPKELQLFQGYWQMTLCDSDVEGFGASQREVWKWRWTIKGNEITWARQGEEWKLSLHVDPDKKPMEIDLTYISGPYKGAKCLGMYEWGGIDGKSLNISIQDPGADVPRPNRIAMMGGGKTTLIFLRKTEPVDSKKELAAFQGAWTFRIAQTEGWPVPIGKGPDKTGQGSERKWVVKGNEIIWTSPDGKEVKASFTIDSTKVPKQIDFTFLSGANKGEKCMGVYEWSGADGKQLSLCVVDPGSKALRPKDISYETNGERSLIVLVPQLIANPKDK
jgi:uncharacterized protein (TIGR03067 family)